MPRDHRAATCKPYERTLTLCLLPEMPDAGDGGCAIKSTVQRSMPQLQVPHGTPSDSSVSLQQMAAAASSHFIAAVSREDNSTLGTSETNLLSGASMSGKLSPAENKAPSPNGKREVGGDAGKCIERGRGGAVVELVAADLTLIRSFLRKVKDQRERHQREGGDEDSACQVVNEDYLEDVLLKLQRAHVPVPEILKEHPRSLGMLVKFLQTHPVAAVAERAKRVYATWLPKVTAAAASKAAVQKSSAHEVSSVSHLSVRSGSPNCVSPVNRSFPSQPAGSSIVGSSAVVAPVNSMQHTAQSLRVGAGSSAAEGAQSGAMEQTLGMGDIDIDQFEALAGDGAWYDAEVLDLIEESPADGVVLAKKHKVRVQYQNCNQVVAEELPFKHIRRRSEAFRAEQVPIVGSTVLAFQQRKSYDLYYDAEVLQVKSNDLAVHPIRDDDTSTSQPSDVQVLVQYLHGPEERTEEWLPLQSLHRIREQPLSFTQLKAILICTHKHLDAVPDNNTRNHSDGVGKIEDGGGGLTVDMRQILLTWKTAPDEHIQQFKARLRARHPDVPLDAKMCSDTQLLVDGSGDIRNKVVVDDQGEPTLCDCTEHERALTIKILRKQAETRKIAVAELDQARTEYTRFHLPLTLQDVHELGPELRSDTFFPGAVTRQFTHTFSTMGGRWWPSTLDPLLESAFYHAQKHKSAGHGQGVGVHGAGCFQVQARRPQHTNINNRKEKMGGQLKRGPGSGLTLDKLDGVSVYVHGTGVNAHKQQRGVLVKSTHDKVPAQSEFS